MSQKIGFWSVLALVMGSQIGSGVFMLPANLAPFGIWSLVGWGVAGCGAILLALVFAKLCAKFPRTGGPHAYVHALFGSKAAFFTGWTYWIISWVSTTAVITASVGYLSPLLGFESASAYLALEIALLLVITFINIQGVKAAGYAEFWLSLLKVIPLVIVPGVALFFFNSDHLTKVHVPFNETFSLVGQVTLIALWGFIGLESATTPAGSVENPSKTIPRAVVVGTILVAFLYFLNSVGILGVIPGEHLTESKAPYADAVRYMWGGNWHLVISLIAAIVCVGTLNAWMLASGQIALGLAQDGLLPPFFAKENRHQAPQIALLISCAGIIPILFLTMDHNLAKQVMTIIDFSVVAFLFVYLICCLAFLKLLVKEKNSSLKAWLIGILAFAFCLGIIVSTPASTLFIAGLFTLSGIPVYLLKRPGVRA